MTDEILALGAVELRDRLAGGALSAVELAEACLARIESREPAVLAWAWIDRDHVLQQARALDEHRASGRPPGPLHGLPVGVKDIVDTAGIPTENGTVIDAGRIPTADAFIVRRLREAGALILGKTVTTELAFRGPGPTRNPHDPARTPGGSSSGSAAAVAAGMVPLAIGTQTAGSMIRPASFCGVVGFKPSFGTIPRTGVQAQAESLDTIGTFASDVTGAALLAECLFGHDPGDSATSMAPPPQLARIAAGRPPARPALAMVLAPTGTAPDDASRDGFRKLREALGEACDEVELPAAFADAPRLWKLVQYAELSRAYWPFEQRGGDRLSAPARSSIETGSRITARDYLVARDAVHPLNAALGAVFDRYDAIVTPAAPGPAPLGLESTGDPTFNGLWTYCGTPAVTLPLLRSPEGMPIGVQVVGRRGDDARLLRTAHWLQEAMASAVR